MRLALATLGKWIVYGCLLLAGYGTSGLADEKPTVTLYTAHGCRPCQSALRSLQALSIDLRVTQDCPAWVQQVPTIHWRDSAGVWRQHAPSHWSGPNWSELETAKLRRWLLPSSATKSTANGDYLTVATSADTREAAAPGPKSNQLAGMRPVSIGNMIAYNVNNLRNLVDEFPSDDIRRGFAMTALRSLETIYDPAESYVPPPRQETA